MNDGGIHVTPSPRSLERRMAYLDRVGEHLRMPDDRRDEVLEEIAAHLDDAIDALMAEGLTIEQAEREAMARLGSPAELGDELRRTHQTTKRLLAAAGGGIWHGLEGAVTGWIMAGVASIPILWGAFALVGIAASILGRPDLDPMGLSDAYVPAIMCGSAWLGARWMVRAISDRSWRREHSIRRQVAVVGAVILAVAVLVVPADYIWLGVVFAIAIPFAFAAGAMSAGGREDGRPWVDPRWPRRFPSKRTLAWGSVLLLVLAPMLIFMAGSITGMNAERGDMGTGTVSPQDPWTTGGFSAVGTRAGTTPAYVSVSYARDGWVLADVPTDIVDWDAWPGLRLEAWKATSPYSDIGEQALDEPDKGPYLVVPVDDPWSQPRVAVRVGQPGVTGYLVFLVAQDPTTGARTVFGMPDGDRTTFHGSLIEWFAAL